MHVPEQDIPEPYDGNGRRIRIQRAIWMPKRGRMAMFAVGMLGDVGRRLMADEL